MSPHFVAPRAVFRTRGPGLKCASACVIIFETLGSRTGHPPRTRGAASRPAAEKSNCVFGKTASRSIPSGEPVPTRRYSSAEIRRGTIDSPSRDDATTERGAPRRPVRGEPRTFPEQCSYDRFAIRAAACRRSGTTRKLSPSCTVRLKHSSLGSYTRRVYRV